MFKDLMQGLNEAIEIERNNKIKRVLEDDLRGQDAIADIYKICDIVTDVDNDEMDRDEKIYKVLAEGGWLD